MISALSEFVEKNVEKQILSRFIRENYNQAALLPGIAPRSGVSTRLGESPQLTKGQLLIALLVAIGAEYNNNDFSKEVGVDNDTPTLWKKGSVVIEKSQELALGYATLLLEKYQDQVKCLTNRNDISVKDLINQEELEPLLAEILETRGQSLRALCIELAEGLKGKQGDYLYCLAITLVVQLFSVKQYDKDSLLLLSCRLLAHEGHEVFAGGIPMNFNDLTPSLRDDINDKLDQAREGK